MNRTKGFLALFLSGIIYSANDIFIRVLGSQLSGFQQVTFRSFVALIIVSAIFLLRKSQISLSNLPKKILFLYGITFPLMFVFFNLSILLTKIADTVFSFFIGSIISSLFIEHFLYKQKITRRQLLTTVITIIGLFCFAFPISKTSINIGFLCGLFSGMIYTFNSSLIQHIHRKIEKNVLVGIQMLGGVIISALITLLFHQELFPVLSFSNWSILVISGSLLMLVTYLTLMGFQNFDLNLGTILLSSELFFAPLFAFILFRESLTLFEMLGGCFIGVAIIIAHINMKKS